MKYTLSDTEFSYDDNNVCTETKTDYLYKDYVKRGREITITKRNKFGVIRLENDNYRATYDRSDNGVLKGISVYDKESGKVYVPVVEKLETSSDNKIAVSSFYLRDEEHTTITKEHFYLIYRKINDEFKLIYKLIYTLDDITDKREYYYEYNEDGTMKCELHTKGAKIAYYKIYSESLIYDYHNNILTTFEYDDNGRVSLETISSPIDDDKQKVYVKYIYYTDDDSNPRLLLKREYFEK